MRCSTGDGDVSEDGSGGMLQSSQRRGVVSGDETGASSAHGPGKRWDESPRRMGFEARRIWEEEARGGS